MASLFHLTAAAEEVENAEMENATQGLLALNAEYDPDVQSLLNLRRVLPSFRLSFFPEGMTLANVRRHIQVPFSNVTLIAPDSTEQKTDMLLTVLGEVHEEEFPERCGSADYSITNKEYVSLLMDQTSLPKDGVNRAVLYLEFKYGGDFEEYRVTSRNLVELMRLPSGTALKRLVDYRHVMLGTNNVNWLYSLRRENTEREVARILAMPNGRRMLQDLYVESFMNNDISAGFMRLTPAAEELLNIPIIVPSREMYEKMAAFRDKIVRKATNLHRIFHENIDTNPQVFRERTQKFWGMVMDYFMALVVLRDMVEYKFVQFIVLVGDNHTGVFRRLFGDVNGFQERASDDLCVDLDRTLMLTQKT